MTLRRRVQSLEEQTKSPTASFWDAIVGAAKPEDLPPDDRAVYEQLTSFDVDQSCPIEDAIAAITEKDPE